MNLRLLVLTLFISIALALSCALQKSNNIFFGNWQEETLEFSNSIEFQYSNDLLGFITSYKWGPGTGADDYHPQQFNWLRNSTNLWSTFSTLKTIGLKRLISTEQYNEPLFVSDYWDYDWEDLSLNQVVEELLKSFNRDYSTTEYYTKFWKRRLAEGNQHTVLKILQQTDAIYNSNSPIPNDSNSINQCLHQLLKGNIELNSADSSQLPAQVLSYFKLLRSKGLHHSAYNLIFEVNRIEAIDLNRDSLLALLHYDTVSQDAYWRTRNSAQWVKTYRDNGP